MFNKLRLNMAIRYSVTLGTAFIAILMLIFLAYLYQTNDTIEKNLARVTESRVFNPTFGIFSNSGADEYTRYSLSIFLQKDGAYIVSNGDFYDEDTMTQLLKSIPSLAKSGDATGRIKINGNFMAYSVNQNRINNSYTAYIYDYTRENRSLFELAAAILMIGTLGLIGIVIFSFKAAEKTVLPVENSFNKQKELVGNASHELKTPLTIISTNLSILQENLEDIPEEKRRWIEGISVQVKRLNNLVVEMLDLAKMDEMQTLPKTGQFSLSDLAERVALEAEVLAFEHNISMVTKIAPNIRMTGIEANIEKLIYILVDNAIKYTNIGGTVTLSVQNDKKRPQLKVINTGEGIDKADLDKLFDRFYRVNKSHTNGEDSTRSFGLGLAIAKSIVDGHQATITVDSEKGKYTEFTVTFKN
ncbi:MAG TPA: HAMP domain-containing sensor histidine kinase [Clostridia bacterium]|nr:HAMP domain-containing sensor histidine kinase [Clostridia bacterium]